jgi:hypothetical protein
VTAGGRRIAVAGRRVEEEERAAVQVSRALNNYTIYYKFSQSLVDLTGTDLIVVFFCG